VLEMVGELNHCYPFSINDSSEYRALDRVVLYLAVLCRVMLCCVVLCCVVLYRLMCYCVLVCVS
jgi:hypothetical protein